MGFVWNELLTPTDFQKKSVETKQVRVPVHGLPKTSSSWHWHVSGKNSSHKKVANHSILFPNINSGS